MKGEMVQQACEVVMRADCSHAQFSNRRDHYRWPDLCFVGWVTFSW